MRRAALAFAGLLAVAAFLAVPGDAPAQQTVERINGIGIVDYARTPTFRVGDWARYHMTSKSDLGFSDDYVVTVVIGGVEEWWGEECFWVETWTDLPGRPPQTTATLMSYAIFGDSLALPHMQLYMRKTISGLTDTGEPREELFRRARQSVVSRTPITDQIAWSVDSLGIEDIESEKGTFPARRVEIKQGKGVTGVAGDSTSYTEVRENRTVFVSHAIPITSIVREDIEYLVQRRTWMTGRSSEASPMLTIERALGSAKLVDFGSGLEARLVPPEHRRSLAEQRRGAAPKRAGKPSS